MFYFWGRDCYEGKEKMKFKEREYTLEWLGNQVRIDNTPWFPLVYPATKVIEHAQQGLKKWKAINISTEVEIIDYKASRNTITIKTNGEFKYLCHDLLLSLDYTPRYEFIFEYKDVRSCQDNLNIYFNLILNRVAEPCFEDFPKPEFFHDYGFMTAGTNSLGLPVCKTLNDYIWVHKMLEFSTQGKNESNTYNTHIIQTWDKPIKLDFRKKKFSIEFYSGEPFDHLCEFFKQLKE